MVKLIVMLIVGYAVLVGAAYLLQDRLIFFPQPAWQEPLGAHVQEITLERPDAQLHGWVVNPEANGPVVFYFGGNAEELSYQTAQFARLDATTVLMNYRGFGRSEGSPSVDRLVDDAQTLVAEMHDRWGAGRPLVLFGRSIGSGIAALAARAAPVDGMILMSPFRSLSEVGQRHMWFLPVRWLLREDLDLTRALDALPDRVLVLHGTRDDIISDAETRALVELLDPPPQLAVYDGGHNEPLAHPQIWPEIRAFVETM
jgi:uncharacterized protein